MDIVILGYSILRKKLKSTRSIQDFKANLFSMADAWHFQTSTRGIPCISREKWIGSSDF
ncbi:MAG: hypothetical protein ACTSWN_13530 [Promethearchaeota archaeon]